MRKSYLGFAEISSCVLLFKFKAGEHRVSLRGHLFVFDINQQNKDFGCKKVRERFSGVAPKMKMFFLDLPSVVKKECA